MNFNYRQEMKNWNFIDFKAAILLPLYSDFF